MKNFFATMIVFALVTFGSFARAAAVDIDLTKMSSTMVYSTVFNMVTNPKNFVGEYTTYPISASETIHACIVRDAAGCCSQGLEFRLTNGNYPTGASEVTVVGTISVQKIDGKDVCYLTSAVLE